MNDSEGIPDSEQIEATVAKPLRRNSRPADGGYGRVEQIQAADLRMCFCHESLVSTSYRRRNLHQANNLSELTPVHLSNPEINLRQQEK